MRDMVEIGMGRTARRTYELDDVTSCRPGGPARPQDVSTAWQLDAYRFEIPVLAHPTDAIVSPGGRDRAGPTRRPRRAQRRGSVGRHADVESKIAQLTQVAEADDPDPTVDRLPAGGCTPHR